MSTTITCFGGAGEIGGNKILLEDNGKRLMLDFGMGFGRVGRYFDGVTQIFHSVTNQPTPIILEVMHS